MVGHLIKAKVASFVMISQVLPFIRFNVQEKRTPLLDYVISFGNLYRFSLPKCPDWDSHHAPDILYFPPNSCSFYLFTNFSNPRMIVSSE